MIRCERLLRKLLHESFDTSNGKKQIKLDPTDIECSISLAVKILKSETTVLRIDSPVTIIGDIHGQFYDLLRYFNINGLPPDSTYLFLGDYVDRGKYSVETISLLIALKVKYPENIFLLRGNHETEEMTKIYGFYNECINKYTIRLWNKFISLFDMLPLAAIINDHIFCVHGGLSPDLNSINDIENIQRPLKVPEQGIVADLLWSDPSTENGFHPSKRDTGYLFGPDVTQNFLDKNDLDLICRAHQFTESGCNFPFLPDRSVLTIFSAPDYCDNLGNKGAMLMIDEELRCKFAFIEPYKAKPVQQFYQTRCFYRTIENTV
ncbi:hypothetical protein M9Y10_009164 [Tritrichomonas musculus]|uniref:Serine/threonine-protein phosphatase n=1 Tax=Tritrichomonas musculus TaxID=1915356 RepID=A0ABR2INS9_9EUKA